MAAIKAGYRHIDCACDYVRTEGGRGMYIQYMYVGVGTCVYTYVYEG